MDESITFGEFLKQMIKNESITQQKFYSSAGIGKPYFYDILSGKVAPPPADVQMRMIDALEKISPQDKNTLLDLAARERGEIPADIAGLIMNNPADMDAIRKILNALLVSRTIKLN